MSGQQGSFNAAREPKWVRVAAAFAVAIGGLVAVVSTPAGAAGLTFVVDVTGDATDISPGDGVCATGSNSCTLRAAITEANASPGRDTIAFSIPGAGPHTIAPSTALPLITGDGGVVIDGYTEPGAEPNTDAVSFDADIRIELVGQGAEGIDGLDLRSAENVVRGLAIRDFKRHVRLFGDDATDNAVVGNLIGIGTNVEQRAAAPARILVANGVHIEKGASRNAVGGPDPSERNVIAGLADRGVALFDVGTVENRIQNNIIGLSPDGNTALGNRGHGVDINSGSSRNIVGGLGPGERNVVSANDLSGVEISHNPIESDETTSGNLVVGNLIGTNLDGTAGPRAFRNLQFGVNFEGWADCIDTCPIDIVDNFAANNTIVGSEANVMIWKGASLNIVVDNRIGTLVDGSVPASAPDTVWGVLIESGAKSNFIGTNDISAVANGIQVRPTNSYACPASNPECPSFDSSFDTSGNNFSRNRIDDVFPGLGIDLAPVGSVSAGGENVQNGIAIPNINSVTVDRMVVTTCAGCRIEVFLADDSEFSDYGQGREYVVTGSAGDNGVATIVFRSESTDPVLVAEGEHVTVTTTDAGGSTSEFSRRLIVARGDLDVDVVDRPVGVVDGDLVQAERLGRAVLLAP